MIWSISRHGQIIMLRLVWFQFVLSVADYRNNKTENENYETVLTTKLQHIQVLVQLTVRITGLFAEAAEYGDSSSD